MVDIDRLDALALLSWYLSLGTAVFGLFGNIVCARVMAKLQRTVKGVRLIKYLTLVDILVLVWAVVFQNIWYIVSRTNLQVWYIYACTMFLFLPIGRTVYMFEIYLTVLISLQRCLALTIPFKFKQVMRDSIVNKVLIGLIIFTTIYNIPVWIRNRPAFYWNEYYNMTLVRSDIASNISVEITTSRMITDTIFYHGVPMLVLTVCNIILLISRWRMAGFGPNRPGPQLRANQLTAIVMAITVMSILVHSLYIVYYVMARHSYDHGQHDYLQYMLYADVSRELGRAMKTVNSSTNFVFYCVFGRQFRQTLVAMFRRKRAKRRHLKQNIQQREVKPHHPQDNAEVQPQLKRP